MSEDKIIEFLSRADIFLTAFANIGMITVVIALFILCIFEFFTWGKRMKCL